VRDITFFNLPTPRRNAVNAPQRSSYVNVNIKLARSKQISQRVTERHINGRSQHALQLHRRLAQNCNVNNGRVIHGG